MFAPVNLPHGATITSMRCGGGAPRSDFRLFFTLRRNDPQQANVDMATVMTTFEEKGFQFVNTNSITSPLVNNARFNYYIVAGVSAKDSGLCPKCDIGPCRIGYTDFRLAPTNPSRSHEQHLDFEGFTVERGVYRLKPGGWEFRPRQDGSFVVARADNPTSGGTIEPCECSLDTGGSCTQATSEDEFGNISEIWCVDDGRGFCVGSTTTDPDAPDALGVEAQVPFGVF